MRVFNLPPPPKKPSMTEEQLPKLAPSMVKFCDQGNREKSIALISIIVLCLSIIRNLKYPNEV